MAMMNAYSAFKGTQVKTASQGHLVVLLYQEAVKQLKIAESLFTSDDKVPPQKIEEFGKCIVKAQDIINELQVSLDMEKGGQIAQNLMGLYVYFNSELMNANMSKDKNKVNFVLNMMEQLLEAWETASKTSGAEVQAPTQRALNIVG